MSTNRSRSSSPSGPRTPRSTRPEIAGELLVSLNTVNTHIRRSYAKVGATDRGAAVRRGRELRLLSASGALVTPHRGT
ncbi:helix-turn-helix transcriptional regulator [Amycolatopsis sp. cmx-4-68]|uniref:helix-turn-helix transcriptional regulator n=1 Tax=Amycolatopsis sp. cmx-4-68 TaxID=2790938 RepID=UPI00397D4495